MSLPFFKYSLAVARQQVKKHWGKAAVGVGLGWMWFEIFVKRRKVQTTLLRAHRFFHPSYLGEEHIVVLKHAPDTTRRTEKERLRVFAQSFFHSTPKLMLYAAQLRDMIVSNYGMTPAYFTPDKVENIDLEEGFCDFKTEQSTNNSVVMVKRDNHLEHRLRFSVRNRYDEATLEVDSIIQTKSWPGWWYLFFSAPVHLMMMKIMLDNAAKKYKYTLYKSFAGPEKYRD